LREEALRLVLAGVELSFPAAQNGASRMPCPQK
jgi:hypothetical protein